MKTNLKKILVVDLDHTLLKSDMLHESFWSALNSNKGTLLFSIFALVRGKASLKNYLSLKSHIDPETLPYNQEVISYILSYKTQGVRTALVTASNQSLADKVAQHLKIFDEVHGSNKTTNLKGCTKADFLIDRFGVNNFFYMADSVADLKIWQASCKNVTVNVSSSLKKRVENLGKPFEHLMKKEMSKYQYIKVLRPHQWLKNLLVFIPILRPNHFDYDSLQSSVVAFIAFCFIASSSYIINDLVDLDSDRRHPRKRKRPFASGSVPITHGIILAIILVTLGIITAALLGSIFIFILLCYYLLTLTYSVSLKRKIILDICVLAGLYTMRIIAGGLATSIEMSVWLLAFSMFFFLSLAAIKRQAELVSMSENKMHDGQGRGYTVEDLKSSTV